MPSNRNMNERERQVYQQIVKNPYISQQKISDALQLSRSTVANLISGLVQKNILLGRAYVLNESRQVVCIGGANVDRKLHSKKALQLYTSNPVHSRYSAGGVARNIAENFGRLGFQPSLITAAGIDADWTIIEQASSDFMKLDAVLQLPHAATGAYTAVLDEDGELSVALADMDVFEGIRPELIRQNERTLRQSECIIADLNCPKETLELLLNKSRSFNVPLAFVTVSSPKMERLPKDLEGLDWMMTNVEESAVYFNKTIETDEQWEEAVKHWLDKGIEYVTLTWGSRGVMVGSRDGVFHRPAKKIEDIKDVTGAGDAFSSGVLYGWLEGMPLDQATDAGIVNAAYCIRTNDTVREDLTPGRLTKDMEE